MKKYVFASLGMMESLGFRLGGSGLGNILFTWARAMVYAKKHRLTFIDPTWCSIKIGPLLRGEFDRRFYNDLFVKNKNISGWKKFCLLNFQRHQVHIIKDMDGLFSDFLTEHDFVRSELLKMTHNSHLQQIEHFTGEGISIHIRMGDFYKFSNEEELRTGKWNTQLPLKWYQVQIEKIRQAVGREVIVTVFSDGSDDALKSILNLPNVCRAFYGSAVADMLALSKSKVLIASGSTFSSWGSFLGQCHTIWFPGQHRMKLIIDSSKFEGVLDYDTAIPKKIINALDV